MSRAVVQGEDGDTASGEYDGYGNLSGSTGETSLAETPRNFALYHRACFNLMARPEYSGPSRHARDQGMPPADEFPEPKTKDDLRALLELAATADRLEREKATRRRMCGDAELELIGAAKKCPHCNFDTFFVVDLGTKLMIRCPNRSCQKLRLFPVEKTEAWRGLATLFADQPVIWDDRKVGPHFSKVVEKKHQISSYEEELRTIPPAIEYTADRNYVTERLFALRAELVVAEAEAEAREKAEYGT